MQQITGTAENITAHSWVIYAWEEAKLCSQGMLSTRGFLFHCKGYVLPIGTPAQPNVNWVTPALYAVSTFLGSF